MESTAEAVNTENTGEKDALERSSIRFPYLDQDDSVELAKKVFELGGKSCDKVALATSLNVSAKGGGFGLRLATAKMFGLITSEKKTIFLTELGQKAVDPAKEKAARVDSFLTVPLYEKLYEDYEGQLLPGNDGLEAHVVKLGVAPKQKDKARQVFQRSAKQAGFFSISSNRLAAPQFKQEEGDGTFSEDDSEVGNGGSGGNGGGGDTKKRHPFIEGLLETLPLAELGKSKTEWSFKNRQDWLQTAAGIFNLIYSAKPDDTGALTVMIVQPKDNSAN